MRPMPVCMLWAGCHEARSMPGTLLDLGDRGVLVCCKWCDEVHVGHFCSTPCVRGAGGWVRGCARGERLILLRVVV